MYIGHIQPLYLKEFPMFSNARSFQTCTAEVDEESQF